MWFSTENGSRMTSFKNKIRGKKYKLGRSNSVEQLEVRKRNGGGISSQVAACDWQYLNFSPSPQNGGTAKGDHRPGNPGRRSSMVIQSPVGSALWSDEGCGADDPADRGPPKRAVSEYVIAGNRNESPGKNSSTPHPTEVRMRSKDSGSAKSRPLSWLCSMPKYFISEESLNATDEQESKCEVYSLPDSGHRAAALAGWRKVGR